MNFAYEWGRLVWWLGQGQNAAAVQALVAVGSLFTTVILIWMNQTNLKLTKQALEVSRDEMLARSFPQVLIRPVAHSWRDTQGYLMADFEIVNVGSCYFELLSVVAKCHCLLAEDSQYIPHPFENCTRRVVAAGEVVLLPIRYHTDRNEIVHEPAHSSDCEHVFMLEVHVKDLFNDKPCRYSWGPSSGLRYRRLTVAYNNSHLLGVRWQEGKDRLRRWVRRRSKAGKNII